MVVREEVVLLLLVVGMVVGERVDAFGLEEEFGLFGGLDVVNTLYWLALLYFNLVILVVLNNRRSLLLKRQHVHLFLITLDYSPQTGALQFLRKTTHLVTFPQHNSLIFLLLMGHRLLNGYL